MSLKTAFLASASLLALACGAAPDAGSTQGTARDGLTSADDAEILPALPPSKGGNDDQGPAFESPPSSPPTLPVVDTDGGAPCPTGPGPTLPVATYDSCADKKVGDECSLCAPWDIGCVETAVVKLCAASGACE